MKAKRKVNIGLYSSHSQSHNMHIYWMCKKVANKFAISTEVVQVKGMFIVCFCSSKGAKICVNASLSNEKTKCGPELIDMRCFGTWSSLGEVKLGRHPPP